MSNMKAPFVKYDIGDFVPVITERHVAATLAQRVRERRKERHLSQKALADRSAVTYASIRRFEKSGEISLSSLLKIAAALDCLPDFLSLFGKEYVASLKEYHPHG